MHEICQTFSVSQENEVSDDHLKHTEQFFASSHEDPSCATTPLCETSSSSEDSSLSGKPKKSVLQKFNFVIRRIFNSRF